MSSGMVTRMAAAMISPNGSCREICPVNSAITTGTVREGRVRILSGVNAGDQVVSAGQLKLRSGQPVVIDNSVELPKGVERG